jgi:hypothetical protein
MAIEEKPQEPKEPTPLETIPAVFTQAQTRAEADKRLYPPIEPKKENQK